MHAPRGLHPTIGFVVQPTNHSPHGFEAQTKKLSRWFWGSNCSYRFWGLNWETCPSGFEAKLLTNHWPLFWGQTKKVVPMVLRPNQETCTPCLLVHGADHKQHHPISWSSSHLVPNIFLTIPSGLHRVSYSCHDPHRCPPCRTCYLHTTRQANMILQPRWQGNG
jgi:hypothetical protein